MSIPKKILNYLDKKGVEVKVVTHKKVYTAYDLAKTMDEKLHKIGKSLLVKVDGKPYLVLVPGHYHLDLGKIKRELKAKKAELASEKHIKNLMDAKPGALHPFKGIHKVEVLLDKALLKSKEAIIRAGSFTESLRMKTKDLHKLENATVGEFGKVALKSAVRTAVKAVKAGKKAGKAAKKMVKKASKTKTARRAAKTKAGKKAKRVLKKAKKTVRKVKKAAKKAAKKSPVKIKIRGGVSKVPAVKRKRR